jgi:hypothetical protein
VTSKGLERGRVPRLPNHENEHSRAPQRRRADRHSLAQFDKLEGILRLRSVSWDIYDVLEMEEQKSVSIPRDGLGRITSARDKMRGIELELYIVRINILQYEVEIVGVFADGIEVIVISERYADIRRAFADLGEKLA